MKCPADPLRYFRSSISPLRARWLVRATCVRSTLRLPLHLLARPVLLQSEVRTAEVVLQCDVSSRFDLAGLTVSRSPSTTDLPVSAVRSLTRLSCGRFWRQGDLTVGPALSRLRPSGRGSSSLFGASVGVPSALVSRPELRCPAGLLSRGVFNARVWLPGPPRLSRPYFRPPCRHPAPDKHW